MTATARHNLHRRPAPTATEKERPTTVTNQGDNMTDNAFALCGACQLSSCLLDANGHCPACLAEYRANLAKAAEVDTTHGEYDAPHPVSQEDKRDPLARLARINQERESLAKTVAEGLARLGRSRRTTEQLVETMSKLHRTEQQFCTTVCLAWLDNLAEREPHQVDARNQASVDIAKAIMSAVPRARYSMPLI